MEIFAGFIISLVAFCGLFGAAMVIAGGKLNRRDAEYEELAESMFPAPCDRAPDDLRLYCPYREKNCDGCEFNLIGGDDDDGTR